MRYTRRRPGARRPVAGDRQLFAGLFAAFAACRVIDRTQTSLALGDRRRRPFIDKGRHHADDSLGVLGVAKIAIEGDPGRPAGIATRRRRGRWPRPRRRPSNCRFLRPMVPIRLLADPEIDAIYNPLPTISMFRGRYALAAGKRALRKPMCCPWPRPRSWCEPGAAFPPEIDGSLHVSPSSSMAARRLVKEASAGVHSDVVQLL